jgi:hypothetical protein
VSGLPPAVTFTDAGPQPQSPASIRLQIVNAVAAVDPGFTDNLPGSLIEDIVSTDVAAVAQCDQARVDLINSVSPLAANPYVLGQLGQVYGVPLGVGSNTSVNVIFSSSPAAPGFVIQPGFVVSDGTHQYTVQDGGVLGSNGSSPELFALAGVSGTWAVPPNTVTQLVTSVPTGVNLSVTNPLGGIPGQAGQTVESYQSQVLQAGLSSSQGVERYVRTMVLGVQGVQQRLVSIRQLPVGWEVIVGGGDVYAVGYAIFTGIGAGLPLLVGSTLFITNITQSPNGQVTTQLNHEYVSGQIVTINDVQGMTEVNGLNFTVTVIDQRNFLLNISTAGFAAYTIGGQVTPNLRNVAVQILDYPDTYTVPYVLPPEQVVTVTATWNTTLPGFVQGSTVNILAAPAVQAYINTVSVGAPILVYLMEEAFSNAVASVLPPQFLTRLIFQVYINGIYTPALPGTQEVIGDAESYFFAADGSVNVVQG